MKKPRRFITYKQMKSTKSEVIKYLENHGNSVALGKKIGIVEYIGETGITIDWLLSI